MKHSLPQISLLFLVLCFSLPAVGQPAKVVQVPASSDHFTRVGEYVYFIADADLYRTDGTAVGTVLLASGIDPLSESFRAFNNGVLFLANGNQLWFTDGSSAGTVALIARSDIRLLDANDNHFFFAAEDASTGRELYRTDGSPGGTVMIQDLNPGSAHGFGDGAALVVNGTLFFPGNDGVHGVELWKSDGLSHELVRDINAGDGDGVLGMTNGWATDGLFFFRGFTADAGAEAWVSDGTSEGTRLLVDATPGAASSSDVDYGAMHNGGLYFSVGEPFDPYFGSFYVTEGTPESTVLLKGEGFARPKHFVVYNDNLYFWPYHGSLGWGIWVSDGTPAGTQAITNEVMDGELLFFDVVDGKLMYAGVYQGYATNVYMSDGVSPQPTLAMETKAISWGSVSPRDYTKVGQRLFVADHDGPSDSGYSGDPYVFEDYFHLWEVDASGASSMRTLWGVNTVDSDNITEYHGNVLFTASEEYEGEKYLWFYDPDVRPGGEPRFILVSPFTDKDVKRLLDGSTLGVIPSGNEAPAYNIRFEPSTSVGSVVFELNGDVVRTESDSPYSIGGDVEGDYAPWYPEVGTHSLTARAHALPGGQGAVVESLTITFHVRCENEEQGCVPTGELSVERWTGVTGTNVTSIPLDSAPDEIGLLSSFEEEENTRTNYGARIRGYVVPPQSGLYTFWIASNDHSELWLSTDETVANRQRIAYLNAATGPRQWNRFASQRSVQIQLSEGEKYYIEALLKQGVGTAHLAVRWQLPDGTIEEPIGGSRLVPFESGSSTTPDVEITSPVAGQVFDAPADILIEVDASDGGDGTIVRVDFYAGDPGELGEKIGEDNAEPFSFLWENVNAGHYELTAMAVDEDGNIVGSVPMLITVNAATVCTASGGIDWEVWFGVSGNEVWRIPVGTTPDMHTPLVSFQSVPDYGTNYGARIRGYICAPQTGAYTFWVASNDHSELWLSTDDDPDNKVRIAWLDRATGPQEWNKFPSQRSQTVWLEAGHRYYIEGLHKQGVGADHFAVGWQLPDGTLERPIAGAHLSPITNSDAADASARMVDDRSLGIAVYPNPANAGLTELSLEVMPVMRSVSTRIVIRNLTGEIVYDGNVNCNGNCNGYTFQVDSPLPAGLYLVDIRTEGVPRQTHRLLVE